MSACSTGNSDLWVIPKELCTLKYSDRILVLAACLAASRWPNRKKKTETAGPESLTPCFPDLGKVLSECVPVRPWIQVRTLKISKASPEVGFLVHLLSLSLGALYSQSIQGQQILVLYRTGDIPTQTFSAGSCIHPIYTLALWVRQGPGWEAGCAENSKRHRESCSSLQMMIGAGQLGFKILGLIHFSIKKSNWSFMLTYILNLWELTYL